MIDSFSYTPFTSERRSSNNAVTSIADVRHIVITLLWRLFDVITFSDVNLNDGVGDVHYNQCTCIKHARLLDLYLTPSRIIWIG